MGRVVTPPYSKGFVKSTAVRRVLCRDNFKRINHTSFDLFQESKCLLLRLGAEAGTEEMLEPIKKKIEVDHIPITTGELVKPNIVPGAFWIRSRTHFWIRSWIRSSRIRSRTHQHACAPKKYRQPSAQRLPSGASTAVASCPYFSIVNVP
ncbi:MAG: hypothetical protein ACI87O_001062 [Planctomycetota bacterium]|jgi:hypothetical protein